MEHLNFSAQKRGSGSQGMNNAAWKGGEFLEKTETVYKSKGKGSRPNSENGPRPDRIITPSNPDHAVNEDQIQKVARAIGAKWETRRLPDLVLSLLTGSKEKSFRTLTQRNAFQAGIRSIVACLPGTIFIFDSESESETVKLVEVTMEGIGYYENAKFGSQYKNTVINAGSHAVKLQQPTTKRNSIYPLVGVDYTKVIALQSDSPADNARMRAELELAIWTELHGKYAKKRGVRNMKGSPVGSVAVLIQGTLEELSTIPTYLKNQVPFVIYTGLGGVADLLTKGLELRQTLSEEEMATELMIPAMELFPEARGDEVIARTIVNLHLEVLSNKNLRKALVVVEATPENLMNMKYYIVKAVLEGSKSVPEDYVFSANLHLAIRCFQTDATMDMLIDQVWEDFEVPYSAFELAVGLQFRYKFVDLFLQDGFPVREHLTHKRLLRLFQMGCDDSTMFFWNHIWNEVMGRKDNKLMDEKFILKELNPLIYQLSGIRNFVDMADLTANALKHSSALSTVDAERKAINALIVFSIMNNDFPLLKVLIKYSQDPIPTTIFAERMYRGLVDSMADKSVKAELTASANKLADMAKGMLDMAYNDNNYRARAMLIRDLPDFNNQHLLELAFTARDKSFTSHRCVQEFLSLWYYGFIDIRGSFRTLKILLSALFIFPMYWWLSFPALERTLQHQRRKSMAQSQAPPGEVVHPRPQTDEEKHAYLLSLENKVSGREPLEAPPVPLRSHVPFSKKFYAVWNSPAVKFHTHQFFYYTFLVVIAVDVMLPPCRYIGVDIAVFAYTMSRWLAIVCQEVYRKQNCFIGKPMIFWMELIVEATFNIIFFLYRIAPYRYDHPWAGRVILSFGVLYYYYRVWDLFYVMDQTIGPSIRLVVRSFSIDVLKWMLVTYNFFFAGGVVWQAIAYPDWPMTGDEWRKALYRAVFTLFGGFASDLEYSASCEPGSRIDWSKQSQPYKNATAAYPAERCWIGQYYDYNCNTVTFWSYLFYIHWYFFVCIGSMYVLSCAIFTRFIDEWVDNAVVWKYDRCGQIMGYGVMSSIPPPFNTLGYLLNIVKHCMTKTHRAKSGLKNMIEMEKLNELDPLFTGSISSYWSNLATRYFIAETANESSTEAKIGDLTSMSTEAGDKLSEFVEHLEAIRKKAPVRGG